MSIPDTIIERLVKAAGELADAVSFDVNGRMVGKIYSGGNGGLVSTETLAKVDEVQRVLSAVDAAEKEASHG